MKVELANPRGFCAGVERAIEIVERALEIFGAPIFVRHEVVHNRFVVESLREKGAIFVEELSEVPDGATVIFSAHGVSQAVRDEAVQRGFKLFDATCPLVTKVHLEVARHCKAGDEVILIGHAGHPEVEGTMGQYGCSEGRGIYLVERPEDVEQLQVHNPDKLALVTQTTLSMDDAAAVVEALQSRFPKIVRPKKDDICYATQNRQDAIKSLAESCDLILVVGSPNSSNSNRLREIAERHGVAAHLVDSADDIDPAWLVGCESIGVSAGASAPELLVKSVIDYLQGQGATRITNANGLEEDVVFSLPKELRD
ncbi:4-hydroxy-3-methylbut-2-enyl diphosphate reductase [Solemya pervernicosa gill symbiont]|uniref:4-hydroxy-3-methylbut-2-enyl diphosphate reductase n=1 Tax=Solemya pervernicosa gill symbiont TaxID=642797 RepID=A0A1T2L8I9_9GAMM|nr:4-hydroxy-3-methylbut-2-enyl diphosphate reductase [Solemya pervernicosa gill symbiont]OOZ41344.1 4-hydroxy-3-methylbut-2-enyl diphosphate reductase [Solemya pervernicosa gill symbiont]